MHESYLQPLTTWLHTHPISAILFAFFVAFLESLAVIGSIVPGSVTLTAVGVLIGSGVIPFWPAMLAAVIGAVLGDCLSYALGHHYKEHIKTLWPLSRYPNLLTMGERFFAAHGGKSILVARFIGPIRAILPIVVGMLKMPFFRFLLADIVSALLWAPTYLFPGIVIGAASLELSPEAAARLIIYVFIGLIALWLIGTALRYSSAAIFSALDRLFARCWRFLRNHPSLNWIASLLEDPRKEHHHRQLVLLFLAVLTGLLVVLLSFNVMQQGWTTQWNISVFHFMQSLRFPKLDSVIVGFTFLGDKQVILPFMLLVAIGLYWQGHRNTVYHWLGNGVLVVGTSVVLKYIVQSPRPEGLMITRTSFSFPSGHTTLSTAIYGILTLLICKQLSKEWRRFVIWPMTLLILGIPLSRLYLGAHWLTDIIGGLLLGSFCICLSAMSYQRYNHKPIRLKPFLLTVVAAIVLSWMSFSFLHYSKQRYAYTPKIESTSLSSQQWWQQKTPVLPLYRLNRFAQPIENFTVQWSESLSTIESTLQQHGWQTVANHSFMGTLNRLLSTDKTQTLPVLPRLYKEQYPVLVMTKSVRKEQPLLVLRLWNSQVSFTDKDAPLWIGTLTYRIVWKHHWLETHQSLLNQLTNPDDVLRQALTNRQIKIISYPETKTLQAPRTTPKNINVLLIQP